MESSVAVAKLAALAHESRLAIYRLLIQAEPHGLAAGAVGRQLNILPNTLSASLSVLAHAGLVCSRREGRSIIYRAERAGMRALLAYLVEDCCAGSAEICMPLASVLARLDCCSSNPA